MLYKNNPILTKFSKATLPEMLNKGVQNFEKLQNNKR